MKPYIKSILKYAGIILLFLAISYAYMPQLFEGKIVNQSDISGYKGMSHEMSEWNSAHPDDKTEWTNSMFSGMPTTTFSAPREGDLTQPMYDFLLLGKRPATYLFVSLLGAFLMMLAFGVNCLVAVGAAIAVTFCSYNFQIIQVGHNTKMQAIAFLPWALAAFVFTYRAALGRIRRRKEENAGWKNWLPMTLVGAVLFAFAVSFQVKANHQQITYYLAIMLVIYAVVEFVSLLVGKQKALLGRFFAASALLVVLGLTGVATNANKLIPVYKYTAQSMRGGSELASASNAESGGLDLEYATAWSYGWEEIPNLLIPNFNGGSSSGAVNPDKSATYELLRQAGVSNLRDVSRHLPLYWGPQPFTAGPMYMGAVTVFLFILGLFLSKGKEKWWVAACTILAILLAVGSHLLWFTKLFSAIAPLYNKFRTVSMALIVLQFTLPVLGFIALDRIMKGDIPAAEFRKKGLIAFGITAGFCLLFALVPSLAGTFTSASDQSQNPQLVQTLITDRKSLLAADALRSFILITASFLLILWGFSVPKNAKKTFEEGSDASYARRRTAALLVCFLVLVDLFAADKRYLNSEHFITPRDFTSQFNKRPVDEIILTDTDPSYRVLDLSVSTFNDYHTPYWHKSIGGYSPAKLQRYQELIDRYIVPEINSLYATSQNVATVSELEDSLEVLPVLSALNTRYVILGAELSPVTNRHAYGNAWFISDPVGVQGPDDALSTLGSLDLLSQALYEPSDLETLSAAAAEFGTPAAADENDSIVLTSYAPNELRYHYRTSGPRLAVFSEVFYPGGWSAWTVDGGQKGVDVPVFRSDWILRSAVLPAGEHELVMRFDPRTNRQSAAASRISSIILILILLLSVGAAVMMEGKKEE